MRPDGEPMDMHLEEVGRWIAGIGTKRARAYGIGGDSYR
jgi:hypothetical protein